MLILVICSNNITIGGILNWQTVETHACNINGSITAYSQFGNLHEICQTTNKPHNTVNICNTFAPQIKATKRSLVLLSDVAQFATLVECCQHTWHQFN